MSSLAEWLAGPAGAEALQEILGTAGNGRPGSAMLEPEMVAMVGSFPMSALAGSPNAALDHAALDDLVERLAPGPD